MSFFDRIRAMPPQRQILLVVGSLVIFGFAFGAIYFVFLRQPDAILFSNLRAADAATIVADLDKKKVPYHLADDGTTILVAQNQVDTTRLGLLSEDLPLRGTVGFELFNKSDIGLTEFAQKINYQRALQGELARTIMAMDAVDTARVHLSLPDATIFQDDKREPKASIALTLKPGRQLSPGSVRGIQRLVAAAVSDLNISNVVVLDGDGQVISSDVVEVDTPLDVSSPETPSRHAAETYYDDKVRQALAATYPDHTFTIKVTAKSPDGTPDSGPSAEDTAASDGVFAAWTPEMRKFPLKVEIGDATARDNETTRNIRTAAGSAISENPSLGDEISVTSQVMATQGRGNDYGVVGNDTATAYKVSKTGPALPDPFSKFPWPVLWIIIAVAIAIGGGSAVARMRRTDREPRQLTDAERRAFVSRFHALLEQGEGDASDRF
jgi:flagellar M-ring protein FliF